MVFSSNEAIVRREYEECWSDGDLAVLDETCSGDVVLYGLPTADTSCGTEELKQFIEEFRDACSDVEVTLNDVVADRDRVVVRSCITATHDDGVFMDTEPDDDEISINRTTVYRVEDGRIAEAWMCFDTLGLLQQMDAVPPHPQAYDWEKLGSDVG